MDLMKIGKTYKNVKRLRKIVYVLIKYGFEYLIHRINLSHLVSFGRRIIRRKVKVEKLEIGEKVRLICEELGPTFIKFGQILSMRTDIFPVSFTEELSKLQDEVKPFPFAEAKKILLEEYKTPLENIFSSFDETPHASASIAQVHFAVLKANNEKVIVKVQRPHLKKEVETDIDILFYLAHLFEKYLPEIKKRWSQGKLCLLKNGEAITVTDGKLKILGEERFI
jgi:ubiquinone biosynthesis protein